MAGAVVEVKYFNSFVLKKTITSANAPAWNGSFGIPTTINSVNVGYPQTAVDQGGGTPVIRNWGIEESRIRGGYNNVSAGYGARAYLVEDDTTASFRVNSLIYSGIFNSTTGINQSNVFNVGEDISKSLSPANGSIQKLFAQDYFLTIFQENKVSRAPINKNVIYSAEGSPTVTTSNLVIGDPQAYNGDFGISRNPESWAVYGFRQYFTDKDRNAVLRLSQNGLEEIQRYGMYDFFRDKLSGLDNQYGPGKAIGMWDIHTKQYVLSLQPNSPYVINALGKTENVSFFTVSFDESVNGWTSFYNYKPGFGTSLKNLFYTFDNGSTGNLKAALYKQNSEAVTRNNFYGQSYKSSIVFIFNPNVSISKVFKTINYEGSNGWQVDSITSDFTGIGSVNTGWATTATGQTYNVSNTEDSINKIYSYNEGSYDNYKNQYPALLIPPINYAGFNRKENKYFANIVNNSSAVAGEVIFGKQMTGIKGHFSTVTVSTDNVTDLGGVKELFAVSSEYVQSGY
tara:strand:- start:6156 stop:7691 length:1536 start_codon:yes stop_codon:yes gene_type:complete